MGRKRLGARAERWNSILTAVLLFALVALINRSASRTMRWRADLSEDQLYAVTDATRSILGRLEDRLLVKAYFSGEIESGTIQLAKARIEAQLSELAALGGDRIDVTYVDPAASTAALQETRSYGIEPQSFETVQGTQTLVQPVYLGLLLRYRGREEVIAWADPWGFEVQLSSAVHALLSDKSLRVGWYEHSESQARNTDSFFSSYSRARQLISQRAELVPIPDLRDGDPKSLLDGDPEDPRDDLDVLFVVRPREEHPRAAFEIDQFVRGGGRVVLLLDQADYNVFTQEARRTPLASAPPPRSFGALEQVLNTWRVVVNPYHVWDFDGQTNFGWIKFVAGNTSPQIVPSRSPALITIPSDGFDASHAITTGLQRATLSWAQPITLADPPPGVARVDLILAGEDSYNDEIRPTMIALPEQVRSVSERLLAGKRHDRVPLAAAFTGVFPSAFPRVPAPFDPILDADPQAPLRFVADEAPLAAGKPASLVVFGDADWLRDDRTESSYPFLNAPGNATLLMNVLDWLALDEELIALRRKSPIERSLRDFEREAHEELGVLGAGPPDSDEEARRQRELLDEAMAMARREEWQRMLLPLLVTLGLVLGFGLAWNLLERRSARS